MDYLVGLIYRDPLSFVVNIIFLFSLVITILGGLLIRLNIGKQHYKSMWLREKRNLEKRDRELSRLKARVARYFSRSPRVVQKFVEQRDKVGDLNGAKAAIDTWMAREGEAISVLLLWRGEWAMWHAVGDDHHALGIALAEGYTKAALAFDPGAKAAKDLLNHVQAWRRDRGITEVSFPFALNSATVHGDPERRLNFSAIREADAMIVAAREGERLRSYKSAFENANAALEIFSGELGGSAGSTLLARALKASCTHGMGLWAEALQEVETVAQLLANHSAFGQDHIETLYVRCLGIVCLLNTRNTDEALRELEAVNDLGRLDSKPDTHLGLHFAQLEATALVQAKRYQDARERLEKTIAARRYKPDDLNRLAAHAMLGEILLLMGELDGAKKIVEDVLSRRFQILHRKPDDSDVLQDRVLLAHILSDMGKWDEASSIAHDVLKGYASNTSLGENHPQALFARTFFAITLYNLGEVNVALALLEENLEKETKHHSIGGAHFRTKQTRDWIATIRAELDA